MKRKPRSKVPSAALPRAKKIWMDGKFVDWDDAKIHVLSHVVHYGSSIFEGIRCYKTKKGSACFRLEDHIERFFLSAKIYRMEIPFSKRELIDAAVELIRINKLEECYIRPLVFRGYGYMGVNPLQCPVHVAIAAWRWGQYLGAEGVKRGIDVCTSTWARMAPNTLPLLAKAGGNYLNSQLIKMEAMLNGYDEGIAVDVNGYVCEGSGENVFIVKGGGVITPPSGASILPGITRNSTIVLAKELGLPVRKQMIPREGLYIADEIFLTGTAAELTPVRSVDRIPVGDGKPGKITKMLQREFFAITRGEKEDRYGWLYYV